MPSRKTNSNLEPEKNSSSSTNQLDDMIKNLDATLESFPTEKTNQEEQITKEEVQAVISEVARIEGIPFEHAYIGVAELLQKGAYLKSVSNRATRVADVTITKKNLTLAMERKRVKITLRQFARSECDQIQRICERRGVVGNLFSQFKREHPTMDPKELFSYAPWCTDFHIDNPLAPDIVKEFLAKRETARRAKKRG